MKLQCIVTVKPLAERPAITRTFHNVKYGRLCHQWMSDAQYAYVEREDGTFETIENAIGIDFYME